MFDLGVLIMIDISSIVLHWLLSSNLLNWLQSQIVYPTVEHRSAKNLQHEIKISVHRYYSMCVVEGVEQGVVGRQPGAWG